MTRAALSETAWCATGADNVASLSDEPFTVCPVCREVVNPADKTLQYAVELYPRRHSWGDSGIGAFFHPDCYAVVSRSGWRAKPHPASG
jgi:hypothetical protein